MNTIIYNLMNKINNTRILDEEYLENLYQFYTEKGTCLGYEPNIEQDDFKKIFTIVYDVLRLKINEEEFKVLSERYVKLLMHDAMDGYNVDYRWAIDHVWYLGAGLDNGAKEYNDCIPFIQDKLIKEFAIKEKITETVKRKIYTGFMSR